MAVDSIGSPTIVPPAQSSTGTSTVPTNAGVFQAELAADSVAQQVQQIQEAVSQPQATEDQQTNEQSQDTNSQSSQATASSEDSSGRETSPAPSENRGENVNIEV